MSSVREPGVSDETGRTVTGYGKPGGSWSGVLYLAWEEARKNRRSHLVAFTVALALGGAAAYTFGLIPEFPGGSPAFAALNLTLLICIGVLPHTSAWASGELSEIGRALSSEGHIAFLKTLPLTFRQISAARALVAGCSALVLVSSFLGSFYALSEPLRGDLGAGGLLPFALFWIGCALMSGAIGLFTELGLGGLTGFWVYMVLIFVCGSLMGGYGATGVDVVSPVIELIWSRGSAPGLAVLLLGSISLGISWLATAWRLNRKGVGS